MWYEMFTLYTGIPMRQSRLDIWVEERLGANGAAFFMNINGIELKRAFCFGLRENVLVEGPKRRTIPDARNWTLLERVKFLHKFGTVTESDYLKEVAIHLKPEPDYREHFSYFEDDEGLEANMAAARRLVGAEATKLDNISPALVS